MKCKDYAVMAAAIFLVVGLMHLSRLIMDWNVILGGWMIPQWVSIVGAIVALWLSYQGFVQGGVIGKK